MEAFIEGCVVVVVLVVVVVVDGMDHRLQVGIPAALPLQAEAIPSTISQGCSGVELENKGAR